MDNYSAVSEQSLAENQTPPESSEIFEAPPKLTRGQRYLRRLGCLVVFVVWLICMTMPCFFVTLMVENEVVHRRSDRPGHEVRVFRVEDSDTQGFGLSWGSLKNEQDNGDYCVSTTTRFLVWEGTAETTDYCECYEQVDEGTWQLTGAYQADCKSELEFDLESNEE